MNISTPITTDKKQVYEKLYGRELTRQEHFEIQQNLVGFIETLIKLNKKQKLISITGKQDRRSKNQ